MAVTPNFNLTKPAGSDIVNVAVLNDNFDKIDANAVKNTRTINGKPLSSDIELDVTDLGTAVTNSEIDTMFA